MTSFPTSIKPGTNHRRFRAFHDLCFLTFRDELSQTSLILRHRVVNTQSDQTVTQGLVGTEFVLLDQTLVMKRQ